MNQSPNSTTLTSSTSYFFAIIHILMELVYKGMILKKLMIEYFRGCKLIVSTNKKNYILWLIILPL
jgi:hypothetical protein